jgi:acyl-CoA dehydrogenase
MAGSAREHACSWVRYADARSAPAIARCRPWAGSAAREFHVERYWREARLMRLAPISQEMALNFVAEHVLSLPRSY